MKLGYPRLLIAVLLSAFIMCPSSETSAQKITSSGFEDFDLNNSSLAFLAKRFNYYYFIKRDFDASYVMVFDTNMSRKAIVELDFLPEKSEAFTILSNRDGFVAYFKTVDRKDSTVIQRVELNDYLRMHRRPESIDTLEYDLELEDWISSPSEQYTMAVLRRQVRRSRDNDEYYLKLYDQAGNRLKTLTIPNIYDMQQASLKLDNDGTVYFAQPGEVAERIAIWTSRLHELELNQNFITEEPYLVNKLFLHQNPSSKKVYFVVDFHKVEDNGDSKRGFGFGDISSGTNITYHEVESADNPTLAKLFSGDNSFKLKFLNPVEDGGLVIGIEEYSERRNNVSIGGGLMNGNTYTRVEYEYELGDIHIMNVDKDGKSVWTRVYPKHQASRGELDPSLSFGVINKGSSITLYYNQLENKNKIILEGRTIFPDGRDREVFFVWKNAKKDFSFLVNNGVQISRAESIVPVYSQGQLGLAKIDME